MSRNVLFSTTADRSYLKKCKCIFKSKFALTPQGHRFNSLSPPPPRAATRRRGRAAQFTSLSVIAGLSYLFLIQRARKNWLDFGNRLFNDPFGRLTTAIVFSLPRNQNQTRSNQNPIRRTESRRNQVFIKTRTVLYTPLSSRLAQLHLLPKKIFSLPGAHCTVEIVSRMAFESSEFYFSDKW